MNKKRILLTGGTGYVGRHLVEYMLTKGFVVGTFFRAIPPPVASVCLETFRIPAEGASVSFFENVIDEFKPSVVVHLAAHYVSEHTSDDVQALVQVNVGLGAMLLEAMKVARVKKFISAGTLWQNYNNEPYNPVNLYASTKEAFDAVIAYFTNVEGFSAISLVLMDMYGGNDTRAKLIPMLARAVKTNRPLDFSDGGQRVCLTYIGDVMRAFEEAIRHIEEQPCSFLKYSAVRSDWLTLREVVDLYEEVHNVIVPCRWGARLSRKRELVGVVDVVPPLPNWQPSVSLREGLLMGIRD